MFDNFQNLLKTAGSGKTMVFLITDTQIKEESFLEDIDNLLNTGEVPNIFAADEKSEIMEVMFMIYFREKFVILNGSVFNRLQLLEQLVDTLIIVLSLEKKCFVIYGSLL